MELALEKRGLEKIMIEINNLDSNVIQSIDNIQNWLTELALDSSLFDSIFTTAFGNNIDTETTESLEQQWVLGDFQEFPLIEFQTPRNLNRDRGEIYLAEEFINLNTRKFEADFFSLVGEIDLSVTSVTEDMVTLDAFSGDPNNNIFTFGDDDRVLVGDTDWDQKIAFITVNFPDGSSSGFTGALISPFHILTVAHGIYHKGKGGFVEVDSIQVSLGQDGTERYYGTANALAYNYFTGYTDDSNWQLVGDEWQHKSNNDDMAIITLDRNIGNFTGWFGYKFNNSDSYFQNLTVNTAGYPSDLANSWFWIDRVADVDLYSVAGPIIEVNQETLRYELDSAAGQSGSPVWTYNSTTEERHLVGVHSFGSTSSNGAVRITEGKFNGIQDIIEEDKQHLQPLDRPDFVDYDDWFGTNFAYFQNNATGSLVDDSSNLILSVEAGDFITLRSVIRNNGTSRVDGSFYFVEPTIDVSFYASTDQDINFLDYQLGDVTISALDPFEWVDVVLDATFPDIPEGFYYIGYTFDSIMSEFDTTNNQGIIDDSFIQVI